MNETPTTKKIFFTYGTDEQLPMPFETFVQTLKQYRPKEIYNSTQSTEKPCILMVEYKENDLLYKPAHHTQFAPFECSFKKLYNLWTTSPIGFENYFFLVPENVAAAKSKVPPEIEFCQTNDFVKNEHGRYMYQSMNGVHQFVFTEILIDYKQFLIDKKLVIEVK